MMCAIKDCEEKATIKIFVDTDIEICVCKKHHWDLVQAILKRHKCVVSQTLEEYL